MIDGVILVAIVIPILVALFQMLLFVANSEGGTKGITKPYTTKSGKLHTAKKSRQEYIV